MFTCSEVVAEVHGQVACLTLLRPAALNALSLPMIRALTAALLDWTEDPTVAAVAVRGSGRTGPFGSFSAGGDIRFLYDAALAGSAELDAFFTEEYRLNHLIHDYPKPYLAFIDGVAMGGGMGISQGARIRIVTERTKMAMPETNIGLFPDAGGGYFLSRCPGRVGEWLALTGEVIGAGDALEFDLADTCFEVARLPSAWSALASIDFGRPGALEQWLDMFSVAAPEGPERPTEAIDRYFSMTSVAGIVRALEADGCRWAQHTAASLRRRSPLMLNVALEQVRRARDLSLADELRMERDLMRHCFHPVHLGRDTHESEAIEGIRALAVDKDHTPHWNPARIEDVKPEMIAPFFANAWDRAHHPLHALV